MKAWPFAELGKKTPSKTKAIFLAAVRHLWTPLRFVYMAAILDLRRKFRQFYLGLRELIFLEPAKNSASNSARNFPANSHVGPLFMGTLGNEGKRESLRDTIAIRFECLVRCVAVKTAF